MARGLDPPLLAGDQGLAQPITLLLVAAYLAAMVLAITVLHLLCLNTRLLQSALHPPLWRRASLVAMAGFCGFFAALSLRARL